MIRIVLFDLYETLITQMGAQTPTAVASKTISEQLGISAALFQQGWRALLTARMTTPLAFEEALERICADCGVAPPAGVISTLAAARQHQKDALFSAIDPSVLVMLEELRRLDVAVGIISNCTIEDVRAFDSSPLAGFIDVTMWSFAEGLEKPDVAIYEAACRRLGGRPADALFVGDGSFDELEGAAAAGLLPLWASWFARHWPEELHRARQQLVQELWIRDVPDPRHLLAFVGEAQQS